jgi:uncharacterized protein
MGSKLITSEFKSGIEDRILRASAQFPSLVVTGARQTGKTTLLRGIFPYHHYVRLDDPSVAELAEEAPQEFLSLHPAPLLIDEVQ